MGTRGCSWCAQLDKTPGLREQVELLERHGVDFDVEGRCEKKARDCETNARFRPLNPLKE